MPIWPEITTNYHKLPHTTRPNYHATNYHATTPAAPPDAQTYSHVVVAPRAYTPDAPLGLWLWLAPFSWNLWGVLVGAVVLNAVARTPVRGPPPF